MKLDRPGIWRKIEKVCRSMEFGEILVKIKVKEGKANQALIREEWISIKDDPPEEDLVS